MGLARRAFLGGATAWLLAGCREDAPAPIVGSVAPELRIQSIDGADQLTLAEARGQPVVVNFFATWCVPCKKELPTFQSVAARYAERGLTFRLVDLQEDPDEVAMFLSDLKITLPAGVDQSGEAVKSYRVRGLPSTFFIGRDGLIKQLQLGELDERALESGISKII